MEMLDLRCTVAASLETAKGLASALPVGSAAVVNCAIALCHESTDAERKAAWEALRNMDPSKVRDSYVQSLVALTLNMLTLDGKLAEDSRSLGNINTAVADILSSKSLEASVLEFILLMAADRFDLAAQVYTRIVS